MKQILRAYKKTVSIVNETAVGLYEGLARRKTGFLLESYDKNNGRYTFFGTEPEEIITSRGNSLVVKKADGSEAVMEGNPLECLREYFDGFEVRKDAGELAFTGGLVGCLGYDFIRYTENLPDNNYDEIGIETIQLMLAKKYLVIDHVAETLTGVCLDSDDAEGRQRGTQAAGELIRIARENMTDGSGNMEHDGVVVNKSDGPCQYGEKVERIKKYIREGHIFQTVLSQRWTLETKRRGIDLYKELRVLNPSPYLYYFNFGDFEVIGSSPEMLVKKTDNKVYTCPIAGTRPRGIDADEDERLKKELLGDEKERAEHVMLVDLARNDMGRISEFGTVKVSQFMDVQNYSHVMHIVSLVEGKCREGIKPLDLAASFLPAGTLSGAPKIRAMEIIDELEDMRRGLYGGAAGYIDFNGNMDLCITIRTMVKKGSLVYLQAGAGIVADSDPEKEYQECCNKVRALAKTLEKEEKL